ncbi:MAG: hypothetical protein AAFO87_06240 [Cyanobacteria bacterium J06607_6]
MLKQVRQLMAYAVIATGAGLANFTLANPANAEVTIAYCDAEAYAVNVYREGDPEAPDSELKIRIFWREKAIVFLDVPAIREPNPEGYNYSNQFGENEWTLFVPNSEASACSLSRDGEVVTNGEVTQREPSSTGGV